MTYQFRPYRTHAEDAQRVLDFLSRISTHAAYVLDFMVGDFVWQGFRGVKIGFDERIGIWERPDGEIRGLCWLTPPNETAFTVHPDLYGTPDERELIFGMMDWTLLRLPDLRGDSTDPVGVTIPTHDPNQAAIAGELGLVFSGETWYDGNARRLDGDVSAPPLPEGFAIAEMNDSADLDDRVAIHREVWAPSTFTREGYDILRAAPVYRADLDLAVQAPDGRYAAYLIAWFDAAARTLLLEPVGAREEFRRRGLSRALIMETLRRARALGVDRAFVNSRHGDIPANALYRSCGFETVTGWQWWHFPVPE